MSSLLAIESFLEGHSSIRIMTRRGVDPYGAPRYDNVEYNIITE